MRNISEKLGLIEAITNPGADMPSLITEWQGYFEPSAPVDTSPDQLALLGIIMDDLVNGSPSCPLKLQLLEAAVAHPLYGLTLGTRRFAEYRSCPRGHFAPWCASVVTPTDAPHRP